MPPFALRRQPGRRDRRGARQRAAAHEQRSGAGRARKHHRRPEADQEDGRDCAFGYEIGNESRARSRSGRPGRPRSAARARRRRASAPADSATAAAASSRSDGPVQRQQRQQEDDRVEQRQQRLVACQRGQRPTRRSRAPPSRRARPGPRARRAPRGRGRRAPPETATTSSEQSGEDGVRKPVRGVDAPGRQPRERPRRRGQQHGGQNPKRGFRVNTHGWMVCNVRFRCGTNYCVPAESEATVGLSRTAGGKHARLRGRTLRHVASG